MHAQDAQNHRHITFESMQDLLDGLRHGQRVVESTDFQMSAMRTDILQHTIFTQEILRATSSQNGMRRVRLTSDKEVLVLPSYKVFKAKYNTYVHNAVFSQYDGKIHGSDRLSFSDIYDKAVRSLFKQQQITRPRGVAEDTFNAAHPASARAGTHHETGSVAEPEDENTWRDSMDEEYHTLDDIIPEDHPNLRKRETQRAPDNFQLGIGGEDLKYVYEMLMHEIKAGSLTPDSGQHSKITHDTLNALTVALEVKNEVLTMVDQLQMFIFAMIREIDKAFEAESESDKIDQAGYSGFATRSKITRETIRKLEELDHAESPESAAEEWAGMLADFNRFKLYAQVLTHTLRDAWRATINMAIPQQEVQDTWAKFDRVWRQARFSFIATVLQFERMFPFLRTYNAPADQPAPGERDDNIIIRQISTRVHEMIAAINKSHDRAAAHTPSDDDRWYTFTPIDERAEFEEFLVRGRHRKQLRAVLAAHGIKFKRKSTWKASISHYIGEIFGAFTYVANLPWRFQMFMHRNRVLIIGSQLLMFVVFYGINKTGKGYTSMDNPFLESVFWITKTLCTMVQVDNTQWITGSVGLWVMNSFFSTLGQISKAILSRLKMWKHVSAFPGKVFDSVISKCASPKQRRQMIATWRRTGKLPTVCCGIKAIALITVEDELEHLAKKAQASASDFDSTFEWFDEEALNAVREELKHDSDISIKDKQTWCARLPSSCKSCTTRYAVKCRRYVDCSGGRGTVRTCVSRMTRDKLFHTTFGMLGAFSRTASVYYLTSMWQSFAKYFCKATSEINAIAAGVDGDATFATQMAQAAGTSMIRSSQNTRALAEAVTKQFWDSFYNVASIVTDVHANTGVLAAIKRGVSIAAAPLGLGATAAVATGIGSIPGYVMDAVGSGAEYLIPGAGLFARDRDDRLRQHDETTAQIGDPSRMGPHTIFNAVNDVEDVVNAREKSTRVRMRETLRRQNEQGTDDVPLELEEPIDSVVEPIDDTKRKWTTAKMYLDTISFQERTDLMDYDSTQDALRALAPRIKDDPEFRALITLQAKAEGHFRDIQSAVQAPSDVVAEKKTGWLQSTAKTDVEMLEQAEENDDPLPPHQRILEQVEELLPSAQDSSDQSFWGGILNRTVDASMRAFFGSDQVDAETARSARQFLFGDAENTQNLIGAVMTSLATGELYDSHTTYAGSEDTGTLHIYDTNRKLLDMIPRGSVRMNRAWGTKLANVLEAVDDQLREQFTDTFGSDLDRLAQGPMSELLTGFISAAAQDDPSIFNVTAPVHATQRMSGLVPNTSAASQKHNALMSHTFSYGEDYSMSKLSAIDCKMDNIFCIASHDKLLQYSKFKELARQGTYVLDTDELSNAINESTTVGISLFEKGVIMKQISLAVDPHLPATALKASVLFDFVMRQRQRGRFVVFKDGSVSSWAFTEVIKLGWDLDIAAANAVNVLEEGIANWNQDLGEHIYEVPVIEDMTKTQYFVHAVNTFTRRMLGGEYEAKYKPPIEPTYHHKVIGMYSYVIHLIDRVWAALCGALGISATMLHVIRENDPSWVSGSAYTIKEFIGLFELLYQAVYGRKDFMASHRRLQKFAVMSRFFWYLNHKMLPAFRSIRARFGNLSEEMLADMAVHATNAITSHQIITWSQADSIHTLSDADLFKILNTARRMLIHNPHIPGLIDAMAHIDEEHKLRFNHGASMDMLPPGTRSDIAAAYESATTRTHLPTFVTAYPQYIHQSNEELHDRRHMVINRITAYHAKNLPAPPNDMTESRSLDGAVDERANHEGQIPIA